MDRIAIGVWSGGSATGYLGSASGYMAFGRDKATVVAMAGGGEFPNKKGSCAGVEPRVRQHP